MITIYVPKKNSRIWATIAKGSGIVGGEGEVPGMVVIYYEGNLYNAVNLNSYEERVKCAWGRMRTKYPTTAMAMVPAEELIQIGTLDDHDINITDQETLRDWLESR